MNYAFYFAYGLVLLWFLFSVFYAIRANSNYANVNKYIFDSIPAVFTTLGVFGTFIGIFAALWVFDVNNITSSIPYLLEGLKTAFGTSILGIFFSLTFQNFVISVIQHKQEEKEIKESSELAALNKLIDEERKTHELLNDFSKDIVGALIGSGEDSLATQFEKFRSYIGDEIKEQSKNLKVMGENQIKTIKVLGGEEETSLLTQIQRLRNDQNDFAKVVTNIFDENNDNGIPKNLRGLREEQRELGQKNDSNTKEIITALYTTNQMMEEKFDEFARLLAESNTAALIDAVEKVIGDFNTQLASLLISWLRKTLMN
ncbi:MAG: hypothetical protein HND52_10050 [Ignavibacteriae bacterium]|nr:hypothetical protein [Ignavibacteriota bacterium]NOG98290.1 hypothetical protein [Ignavibacteriota bacterium]